MRRPLTLVFSALVLSAIPLLAQGLPYGNVKTFAGDVTLEGKRVTTPGWSGRGTTTEEIRATGSVRLTDDAMPDGGHMTWPMISPAAMASNPAGMKQWRAQVTFTATDAAPRDNAHALAQNITCSFTGLVQATVALAAPPGGRVHTLGATLDNLKARCTGTDELGQKVNEEREFNVPQVSTQGPAPGAVSGSKTLNESGWNLKLTYALAPAGR